MGPRENRPGDARVLGAAPCVGFALIVAFLSVSLAPCPPRVGAQAALVARAQVGHARPVAAYLTVQCPCGCDEHVPAAGSAARLGVALPSAAPDLGTWPVAGLSVLAAPLFEVSFATAIDHVPLLA